MWVEVSELTSWVEFPEESINSAVKVLALNITTFNYEEAFVTT